jgi:hypothetical protein
VWGEGAEGRGRGDGNGRFVVEVVLRDNDLRGSDCGLWILLLLLLLSGVWEGRGWYFQLMSRKTLRGVSATCIEVQPAT